MLNVLARHEACAHEHASRWARLCGFGQATPQAVRLKPKPKPSWGVPRPGGSLGLVDPHALARTTSDDAHGTLEDTLRECAANAQRELTARGLVPEHLVAPVDQLLRERLTIPHDPALGGDPSWPDLDVRLVNVVHASLCGLEGQPPAVPTAVPAAAVAGAAGERKPPPPMLFSLRWLQRHWLGLGYFRNQAGTGLGIKFAPPWGGSHIAYGTARIQCTGFNNRMVDLALLRTVTLPLLRTRQGPPLVLLKRMSHNMVAKCDMHMPEGVALGLFLARHREAATKTPKFTGITVTLKDVNDIMFLLFQSGRFLTVGCKDIDILWRGFQRMAPMVIACARTPENVLLEHEAMAMGMAPLGAADDRPLAVPAPGPARGKKRPRPQVEEVDDDGDELEMAFPNAKRPRLLPEEEED